MPPSAEHGLVRRIATFVLFILLGLVGFLITSHIGPSAKSPDGVFDVSDHHEGKA